MVDEMRVIPCQRSSAEELLVLQERDEITIVRKDYTTMMITRRRAASAAVRGPARRSSSSITGPICSREADAPQEAPNSSSGCGGGRIIQSSTKRLRHRNYTFWMLADSDCRTAAAEAEQRDI